VYSPEPGRKMSDGSDLVEKLAESIADGASIDWEEINKVLPTDPELQRLVGLLRLVADIGDVHRSAADFLPETDHAGDPTGGDPPPGSAPAVSASAALGQWGHLLLLRKIGEGGFGEVYHAHDTWLDHPVALKIFKKNIGGGGPSSRILHEARKLARIRHPNVVSVHGAENHNGRIGFWMDLVEGDTLDELVRAGPMSAAEATNIGREVCRALAAVHQAGMVHRDVKAQNVMRATDGGRIILMDFGAGEFIKDIGQARAQGTPLYLAPEIFAGAAATAQSDIYAVGVLLYYLVSGNFPVRGSSVSALIDAHKRGERRRLRDERPALSERFVSIVERAIDPDPAKRFASAGEMDDALGGTVLPLRAEAAPPSVLQLAMRAGMIGVALIALAGFLGFVACRAFEVVLHIERDFYATPGQFFTVGRQALIPFIAFAIVPAGILSILAGARLLLRKVPTVWGRWEAFRASLDPTAIAVTILLLSMGCSYAVIHTHYAIFATLADLHQAPATASVDGIDFASRNAHLDYSYYSAYLTFMLVLAAFRWLPRLERCCDDPSTVRLTRWATIAVAVMVIAMATLPRRFLFERFEVVRFGNQPAVVIASNGEELLLYDPTRRVSSRVRKSAPDLQRTGMTRLIFER
jgi:Protein kinase domain